jgi:hypothetical protein
MYRADTTRFTWKQFGNHQNSVWGFGNHHSHGKWYRSQFNKAERRYYKNYAKAYVDDPEFEPYVRDPRPLWNSEVDWYGC